MSASSSAAVIQSRKAVAHARTSALIEVSASVRAVWLQRTADAMIAAGPKHFDMQSWFSEWFQDFPDGPRRRRYSSLHDVVNERHWITIDDDCGTTACIAGWLTYSAPDKVAGLIARRSIYSSADQCLAFLLDVDVDVWTVKHWPELRERDPELYGMLDEHDQFGSAVKFLQSLAERAAAQQTPTTQEEARS